MNKKKGYELKTVEDIYDCVTPDNLENFLMGFSQMVRNYVAVVTLSRVALDVAGVDHSKKRNTEIVARKTITYIDDGKQDNKLTIEISMPQITPKEDIP